MLMRKFLFCATSALLMTAASFAASPTDHGSTSSLLQKALKATTAHRFDEARAAYESLCEQDPAAGFPLYARFLKLTKQTTDVQALLGSDRFRSADSLTRARTLSILGEERAALDVLSTTTEAQEVYPAAILAYNILRELGQYEAAYARLLHALRDPRLTVWERTDLFRRLVQNEAQQPLAEVMYDILRALVDDPSVDTPHIRQTISEAIAVLDGQPRYGEFRRRMLDEATSDPLAAWIAALTSIRKDDVGEARRLLESAHAMVGLTTGTKNLVLEELAQLPTVEPEIAEKLYRELVPIAKNPDRIRLKLAGILFKAKRYEEVCAVLQEIDRKHLDEGEQKLVANMRLTALAKVRPATEVVRAFEEEAVGKPYAYNRELAEAPFALLPETPQHLEFRKALQSRLRETTAPPELLILMVSTENQLRSFEAVVAALKAYTDARPNDYEALNEYAIAAGQRAYIMLVGPHETTPPLEQVRASADEAARALWRLVQSRPYAPEPYLRLIELYRAAGDSEKAIRVAKFVSEQTSATAEQVHLAAYLLDSAGLTTDSIALYQEAIKRDPQSGKFKMNLANAYRKLGENDKAFALYKELFEHGSYGRQHHVHQLTEDAYSLAEKSGKVGELMEFWRSLKSRADIPQRDELLIHIANLLLEKKHYDDALEFFDTLAREYPERREEIELARAKAYVFQGNVSAARQVYEKLAERAKSRDELIENWTDFGILLASAGDFAGAIELWRKVATDFPEHPRAARGLILAAQAEIARGNKNQALELVTLYLSRDRGDSDGERQARELLATLSRSDQDAPGKHAGEERKDH